MSMMSSVGRNGGGRSCGVLVRVASISCRDVSSILYATCISPSSWISTDIYP